MLKNKVKQKKKKYLWTGGTLDLFFYTRRPTTKTLQSVCVNKVTLY